MTGSSFSTHAPSPLKPPARRASPSGGSSASAPKPVQIVVTGCAAQVEPDASPRWRRSTTFLGTRRSSPQSWAASTIPIDAPRVQVSDIMSAGMLRAPLLDGVEKTYPGLRASAERLRSSLHVLHHSFGRGIPVVPIAGVVGQVERLVEIADAEIVLTGVDITSYGADPPGEPRLGTLVKRCCGRSGHKRLRLSSIDSIEADLDLIDALGTEDGSCRTSICRCNQGRHDPEAHETPPFARGRIAFLSGKTRATGDRLRRRHHRRVPDGD